MLKFITEGKELNELLGILTRILDIRITYFDKQEAELHELQIKPMSAYCRERRQDPRFKLKCMACDSLHLQRAQQFGNVNIYHCHAGLLEGTVPLYDKKNAYLGSIVFGQLRDKQHVEPHQTNAQWHKLYTALPEYTVAQVEDIGRLLKYISEYIIENELIKYQNKPWAEKLELYINRHLDQPLTIAELATAVGVSASFLSHHFRSEFGMPPRRYIIKQRLDKAKLLLDDGIPIKTTAQRLGFYDEFHFSRAFKAYWGIAPKHYIDNAIGGRNQTPDA